MRFALSIFYKNIVIDGLTNIPKDKPSIFACTHPNSFLDAIIIGAYSPRKLYFLARSDVFNTPFKMWLLSKMNLIPIYRLQEGSENLHKNEETFSRCFEIMKKGGSILIFSEGISITDKLVRPLKKGTARIAFGAESYNNFELNLQIIPMSLNYTYPTLFRSEVIIGISEPIAIKKYKTLFQESEMKAIRQFNQELYDGIKAATIIVNEKEIEGITYEKIAPILRSQNQQNISRLASEQNWVKKASSKSIQDTVAIYPKHENNLSEHLINGGQTPIYMRFFSGIVFLLFWLIGYIPNALPFVIAKKVTAKTVKLIEFYASVRLCLSVVLYIIYLPLMSYIIGSLTGIHFTSIAASILILGTLYVKIRDYSRAIKNVEQFYNQREIEKLLTARKKVIADLN